jgi:hypothetical protein
MGLSDQGREWNLDRLQHSSVLTSRGLEVGIQRWSEAAQAVVEPIRSRFFAVAVDRSSVSRRLRVTGGSHGCAGHHNYPVRLARSANPLARSESRATPRPSGRNAVYGSLG